MYAIGGASGQVGRAAANALIERGERVRALIIAETERQEWIERGQDAAVVDFNDATTLLVPLSGVQGAFFIIPPNYNARAGFAEARQIIATFKRAIAATFPGKVVGLSSIGAQHTDGLGLIEQSFLFERLFAEDNVEAVFLRPGWFMDNVAWQIADAAQTGVLESYLAPLHRKIAMTAAIDVGRTVAELLLDKNRRTGIVEIEGPARYSPHDVAAELSRQLNRRVAATEIPRQQWQARFAAEGNGDPSQRVAMLDGFNSGWIDFEGGPIERRVLPTTLAEVISLHRRRQGIA
jgi:uncharacterized protein YbjT (DUF2867 family)